MVLGQANCANSHISTEYGEFDIFIIKHSMSRFGDVVVLSKGNGCVPLVRVHSECMTGDVFHSQMCDCYKQLKKSLHMISESEYGYLIYLRQEGRGIGLFEKIKAYELQRQGYDTVDANIELGFEPDCRNYAVAADILNAFGIKSVRLITNNPDKIEQLEQLGIKIVERVPCIVEQNQYNRQYLMTKKERMRHYL